MISNKLGIIGLGKVGKALLTNAVRLNLFSDFVLIDTREEHRLGETMDQQQGAGRYAGYHEKIRIGNYADLADAKIIVVAANHYYDDDTRSKISSRQDLLKDNIQELNHIMSNIIQVTQEAILIFISNPVDTWTHLAITEFNYPKQKVIGTGTLLDTTRLKYFLAQTLQVSPKNISAYMLGEHGHTSLLASQHINIAGLPLREFEDQLSLQAPVDFEKLNAQIIEAPMHISKIKGGGTDAAIGVVTADLIQSIMLNEQIILPLSSYHSAGTMGIDQDLSFSLPTLVGSQGIEKTFELNLTLKEQQQFEESVKTIQESVDLGRSLLNKI